MGTTTIMRNGMIAAMGIAGLTLSACASNGHASDRYGSVYDYEGVGGDCVDARYGGGCNAVVAQPAPMISAPVAAPVTGVVYADCSAIGNMNCGHTAPAAPVYSGPTYSSGTTYTQPAAPVYSGTTYSGGTSYGTSTYTGPTSGGTADCPAGTTPQSDGTCMQSSGGYSTGTTSTYSSGTISSYGSGSTYTGSTSSYSGEAVACPAGTTQQSDGTCMQTSSSYGGTSTYSSGSTSSYGSGSSYSGGSSTGEAVLCPAGTVMQSDGTCMESGSSSTSYGGYTSSGGYTASDYLPIRK